MSQPKYHVYLEYSEEDKSGIRFNIYREELIRTFVKPFNANKPFWFGGRLLSPSKVERAVIFWSTEDCNKLILPNGESVTSCKDRKQVVEEVCLGKVNGVHLCTENLIALKSNAGYSGISASLVERRRVHIIHIADEAMKQEVAEAVDLLGLEPVILRDQPNQGQTRLGEFSEYSDMTFAVVLLSPEAAAASPPRVDQNLILQLGFFIGRLGGKSVMPIYRSVKNYVLPQQMAGVDYIQLDAEGNWRYKLAKRLQNHGYYVDLKGIG